MKLSLSTLENQLFLARHDLLCPYFKDRPASLLFLRGDNVGQMYRMLMDEGYRRTGEHLYRPDCAGCRECQVYRVPVSDFQMRKSQRRIFRSGKAQFDHRLADPELTEEKMDLYRRYLSGQHGDPEQSEALDEYSYREFFVRSFLGDRTRELQIRDGDRLVGVGICDLLMDAWSSVYFYFDPDYSNYSPGHYSMLLEVELARDLGFKYYYP
ncbi:MAG: GNAT family N-acetyltransferase, partial [Leptospiraceae bacterium]|nr:GNAT family N-acetyltransferase [Leptospiraceae bacterium]